MFKFHLIGSDCISQPPVFNTPEGIAVFMGVLPMYHSYGLHVFCFRAFMARTTVVLMPKWNMDMTLNLIPRSLDVYPLHHCT